MPFTDTSPLKELVPLTSNVYLGTVVFPNDNLVIITFPSLLITDDDTLPLLDISNSPVFELNETEAFEPLFAK